PCIGRPAPTPATGSWQHNVLARSGGGSEPTPAPADVDVAAHPEPSLHAARRARPRADPARGTIARADRGAPRRAPRPRGHSSPREENPMTKKRRPTILDSAL